MTMMRTLSSTATAPPSTTTSAKHAVRHSLWHSPVPYLYLGLAAMLGLIAFAMFMLTCLYWRHLGSVNNYNDDEGRGDEIEKGNNHVYEENIPVIMAGGENPTFLATRMCSSESVVEPHIARHGL
ncbi:hypothetical protein Scep_017351 [Stephania cephalantha]|uniref:Uncharacterized protein n=1 Tax=Stephania cephalantha TaxID=152367 RepID=A0AAP0NU60_9MAGN